MRLLPEPQEIMIFLQRHISGIAVIHQSICQHWSFWILSKENFPLAKGFIPSAPFIESKIQCSGFTTASLRTSDHKNHYGGGSFLWSFIEPYLDDFVSQAFERICRDYLVRQYKDSIQEIGRYWHHSRAEAKEIDIDIIMREDDGLSAYECKWSKRPLDGQVLSQLKEKADLLDIKRLGFFSRSGFSPSMPREAYRLFDAEALYRWGQSEQ